MTAGCTAFAGLTLLIGIVRACLAVAEAADFDWLAPELLSPGYVHAGQAADVWALGCILYDCIHGGEHPSRKPKYAEQQEWSQSLYKVRPIWVPGREHAPADAPAHPGGLTFTASQH